MSLSKDDMGKLIKELASKLIEMKNDGGYAVVNRMIKGDFFGPFEDSIFSYGKNRLLAERLFKLEKCTTKEVQVYKANDEMVKLHKEFTALVESLAVDMDEEKFEEKKAKVAEFQERMSKMSPEISTSEALVYQDLYTEKDLILTKLEDITDDSLELMAGQMVLFGYNFYSFMLMLNASMFNFKIETNDLGEDADYIDILICNNIRG